MEFINYAQSLSFEFLVSDANEEIAFLQGINSFDFVAGLWGISLLGFLIET